MLTIPKRIELEGIEKLVTAENLEDQLGRAVRTTELVKQRFRQCATRAFMILRNYKGREVSIGRQQLRSQRVLDWLHEIEDFPVVKETYNEILNEVMDLRHAREVLEGVENGRIEVKVAGFSNLPSPFAHSVVLAGVSDLVLMEDRSALLRELHKQILRRIVPEAELEQACLVHSRGVEETVFALRPVQRESFETALDRLLTRDRDGHGPTTAHELAYVFDLEEDLVKEALRDLEQEGTVASGHFVVGGEYQYILGHDLQRLRRRGDTREVFEESRVKAFLLGKQFHGLRTIDDYFDRFLEAGMAFDVFNHVEAFDQAEWLRRREAGDILEGRFLNGRVRYVREKDVPLFLSAFPRSDLNELEAKVLEVVKANPDGLDLYGIVARVRDEREKVKEALETLDYDCYVIRKYQGDGWTTRNLYVPFDVRDDLVKDADQQVGG